MAVTKVDWTQLLAMAQAREERCEALLKELLPELPEYQEALVALDKAQLVTGRIITQMVKRGL